MVEFTFSNGSSHLSVSDFLELIKKCSKKHGLLTRQAAMGQGFDRHLFALARIAEEMTGNLPDLYQEPAFAKINYNIMSTSTLGK
jgi:carnitine O-palmitoyltransferase 2